MLLLVNTWIVNNLTAMFFKYFVSRNYLFFKRPLLNFSLHCDRLRLGSCKNSFLDNLITVIFNV